MEVVLYREGAKEAQHVGLCLYIPDPLGRTMPTRAECDVPQFLVEDLAQEMLRHQPVGSFIIVRAAD